MQSEYHHVQEPVSTAQSDMPVGADMPSGMVPLIEISFRNGMWWSMPPEMSAEIHKHICLGRMPATHGTGATPGKVLGNQTTSPHQ